MLVQVSFFAYYFFKVVSKIREFIRMTRLSFVLPLSNQLAALFSEQEQKRNRKRASSGGV